TTYHGSATGPPEQEAENERADEEEHRGEERRVREGHDGEGERESREQERRDLRPGPRGVQGEGDERRAERELQALDRAGQGGGEGDAGEAAAHPVDLEGDLHGE